MRVMHILVHLQGLEPSSWVQGLQAALPEATVALWQPGSGQPAADYAVVWQPPQALLDEQPGLRALFNIGAGVDALLRLQLPAQTRIVRLDDAGMSVQMAEYVCQAAIRHFRQIELDEADLRGAGWPAREPRQRADFPVGVMGLGVLGRRVAQALATFDFKVRGWSRRPQQLAGIDCYVGPEQLMDFLRASRILVCLLPLTPQTENILNRDTLGALQPGGYLINVARGAHLVEADLLALLEQGQLAGATLDVFRQEPLPLEHPFRNHPKLVLTPHSAAITLREDSIAQIAGKLRAMERGQTVAGLVDAQRAY
jgi:glyoxylate/hydroxypyruvate reductase A